MASRRHTRANPDPNPPPVYENPNLIRKLLRQESSAIPVIKSHSCPSIFEYLEELAFDEKFELSLFKTKSENALDSIVPNPDFATALQIEKYNKSIENFILTQLQTTIEVTNIIDFLETASATIGSSITASTSRDPTEPPFIYTIPVQPIISDQKSAVNSPSSTVSTPKTESPPHTPPHTPHTSAAHTPPTSPRPTANPPRVMAARFAPLSLSANLDRMPVDYQYKDSYIRWHATEYISSAAYRSNDKLFGPA